MSTTTTARDKGNTSLTFEDRRQLLRYMLLQRAIEERGLSLYKQGKVPGSFYDGRGQEAISVGATFALGPDDPVCPLIRDLGAHLVKGTAPAAILGQYMGRAGGVSDGREGNIHFGEHRLGVVGMVSMLPDMMVVAVGMALGFKLRDEPRCALSFFGDGATSVGDWHEAMNFAAVKRVPAIFVLENNGFAYSTPTSRQFTIDPLARAAAYGISGVEVDGNDVEAVFEVTREARERAIAGEGPTLIEARTMRMHGHGAHDSAGYVPVGELERWSAHDPIVLQRRLLAELSDDADLDALERGVQQEVDTATEEALRMPTPHPATLTDGVYCTTAEPATIGRGQAPWSAFANSESEDSLGAHLS